MKTSDSSKDIRKIVSGLYMSLDGIVDAPGRWTGKQGEFMGQDVGELVGTMIAEGDTLLLGRTTFQQFEQFFANDSSGNPMAAAMTNITKFVVSKTLAEPTWKNTNVISDDVLRQISELKKQPGKNINISGSGSLVWWLLEQGLLDELRLFIWPVVIGRGKRLFGSSEQQIRLKLTTSKSLSNGVAYLIYSKV